MLGGSASAHRRYLGGGMRARYDRDDNGPLLRTRLGEPWLWPIFLPDAVGRQECYRTFPTEGSLYLDGYPTSMTVIDWRE